MAIVKMKRLKLVAIRSQREELLRELMLLGSVEISSPESPAETVALSKESAGWVERKNELDTIVRAIGLLDKYAPQKTALLSSRPIVESKVILDRATVANTLAFARELEEKETEIRGIDSEMSQIKAILEALEPWKKLDTPLNLTETRTCTVTTGMIPSSFELKPLIRELYVKGCESAVYEISADKNMRYILLIVMKDKKQEAMEVLRGYAFTQSSLSELEGTPAENVARLKSRYAELVKARENLAEEIKFRAGRRGELKLCADRIMTQAVTAENAEKFLYSDTTFIFEGWIPAESEHELIGILSNYECAWETRNPKEEETPEVPVQLKANALTRPFNMVTEMYSLPSYNGIDPNPQLSWSFTLFFGIMFADIGYGLLMLIAGLLIKYKVRARATVGYMGGLAIICGISCIVFGAITGAFFGDAIPQIASMYGHDGVVMPALIDPLQEPLTILVFSMALGVVHLLVGVTVNGYMLVRDGKWLDAIFDSGSVYITFAGVALGVLGVTWYVLYAGIAFIILTQGRESPSIGGKLGGGLWAFYNFVTGWFGDILSYCRLMALMLAGGIVAQVFNTLGAMTGQIIAFALVFVVGHSFNFALNIIGTYAHTSRLEYLEFFGKFYRDGGRPFNPLTMKTSYYDVIRD